MARNGKKAAGKWDEGRKKKEAQQPAGRVSVSRNPRPPPAAPGDFSFPFDLFREDDASTRIALGGCANPASSVTRCIGSLARVRRAFPRERERERERETRVYFCIERARERAINLSVAKAEARAEVNRADQRGVKITLPRVALAIV